MRFRLHWLFFIVIYLSANGQVFATPIHICSQMALTSTALSNSKITLNIHEHHKKNEHIKSSEKTNETHDAHKSTTMDNCQCIDCDCVQNITGKINSSLLQDIRSLVYFPIFSTVLANINLNFIFQPHSTPYKPPIAT